MKRCLLFLFLVGCARVNVKNNAVSAGSNKPDNGPHKTLVFIQGYHLDEKSWDAVMSKIPRDDFSTLALTRAGRDGPRPATLKILAKKGCQEIFANSILVAHSYGGAIANQMFGYCPQKILKIIYISAIIPNNDELPFTRMTDEKAQAIYAEAVTMDETSITPKEAKVFYKIMDSGIDTKNSNLPKIYSEALTLTSDELIYNEEKFKNLPKAYIVTTNDTIVSVKTQQMFIADSGIENVKKISTGHFPMISAPEDLADFVLDLAKF